MLQPGKIRQPRPTDPDYEGKQDYQGNHDIFEMPEQFKPALRPQIPVRKIAIIVLLGGLIIVVALSIVSLLQQSTSFLKF